MLVLWLFLTFVGGLNFQYPWPKSLNVLKFFNQLLFNKKSAVKPRPIFKPFQSMRKKSGSHDGHALNDHNSIFRQLANEYITDLTYMTSTYTKTEKFLKFIHRDGYPVQPDNRKIRAVCSGSTG